MGYMDSSPHPLPDGWENHPHNRKRREEREARTIKALFKKYKLQTMEKKPTGCGAYIFMFFIAAFVFNYDLLWVTGKNVPFALDFLTVAVGYGAFRRYFVIVLNVTFVVSLILIYSGIATPFIVTLR